MSCAMLLLFFGVLPLVQLLRVRRGPGVNSDTQHGFSATGISTTRGPVSNFADWSFAKDAKEDKRHITVRFKSGAVLLPKDQLRDEQVTAIRAVIRQNMHNRAVLW
jgi:capsule polysaccharide modification protein KpsS